MVFPSVYLTIIDAAAARKTCKPLSLCAACRLDRGRQFRNGNIRPDGRTPSVLRSRHICDIMKRSV
jgi:hypothetical protein